MEILNASAPDFADRFDRVVNARRESADDVSRDVAEIIAKVRARAEHSFRVIKRQFGGAKTRYRGLAKNPAQLLTLFALGNLFLVRRKLMA